jgi:glycosyltransferase involved in cell wall biosynthesis
MERANALGLKNVVFHAPVTKDQMPDLWSICDISLAHLKNDPVFSTVIPSKIFESFGMGRPVMVVQPRGEAVEIVEGHGAGEWVPPENPEALAKAVAKWADSPESLDKMSKAAAEAAVHHSRDRLAGEMLAILERLS